MTWIDMIRSATKPKPEKLNARPNPKIILKPHFKL